MSEKVEEVHIRRKGIVYVRQSSLHQVMHNEESRQLQYAMKSRLKSLGWKHVEVIDEDLGRSAAGAVQRVGFDKLVAQVSLGEVGAVAARELSRFARNNREWQQLTEICRVVNTLLVDHEAVYDARNSNDRLLLGLKGNLNEYELDLLRLRSVEAKRQKAARGEYFSKIPVGYCVGEARLVKHPDRRVREAIDRAFSKTLELGSARQALLWLQQHQLPMPRLRGGGRIEWKEASYRHLLGILKNPVYAGAYVSGKTESVARVVDGQLRRVVRRKARQDWNVLHDQHEAYVDWDDFQRLQTMIDRNSAGQRGGAPKKGQALLSGLLRCRRCGHGLKVAYSGTSTKVLRYECNERSIQYGESRCINFSGLDVDARIAAELLGVVRPAAVEAAMLAARQHERTNQELFEGLQTELDAARYAADRAWKQYNGADPDNRLVVDELERRWNDALERVNDISARIEHQRREAVAATPDPDHFAALATDLQSVWEDPEADPRLKKRIVRTLIEEIAADIDDHSNEVLLVIHWKGGAHTELRVPKRRRGDSRARTPLHIIEAVRTLARVCDDEHIAHWLSRNELRTARGKRWTRQAIASLRAAHKIPRYCSDRCRAEGWLTKKEAAEVLGVSHKTVQRAVERGELSAVRPLPTGPWIFQASQLRRPEVLDRFQQRRAGGRDPSGVPSSDQLSLGIPRR